MPPAATLDPRALAFRRLCIADLPALHRWMNAPHAKRWFGKHAVTLEEVAREYTKYIDGSEPIFSFVVSYDGRDIGLLQWVRFGDHEWLMRAYGVDDPEATNCDVLIGDPDYVHRGLGPAMIRRFLDEIVFADPRATCCIIDPEPDNHVAIRAYEKAGFRFLREVADDGEGSPVHLLELRRESLVVRAP